MKKRVENAEYASYKGRFFDGKKYDFQRGEWKLVGDHTAQFDARETFNKIVEKVGGRLAAG